jgi:hypothetical protein
MIPALRNRVSHVTHLDHHGEPYCGPVVDARFRRLEVQEPGEITCGRCRKSKALQLR